MENLQATAPEFPARINLGRRRTGAPRPANDNRTAALALAPVEGAAVVVDAAVAADTVARAIAASAAAKPAARRQRLAATLASWFTAVAARRASALLRAMPDDRLARAGIARGEIAKRMRECYGLPPRKGDAKAG